MEPNRVRGIVKGQRQQDGSCRVKGMVMRQRFQAGTYCIRRRGMVKCRSLKSETSRVRAWRRQSQSSQNRAYQSEWHGEETESEFSKWNLPE
jgi:hypothetical protein